MSDLVALARRVVGTAGAGEQIEAYVTRGRTCSVKVLAGAVESLSVAESAGVGIRVVVGDRQGFAWAGTLHHQVVAETLAEARDNARFAEPDPWVGLAEPDGVEAPRVELWDERLVAAPTEAKVTLALDLERAATSVDPRVSRVRSATYADGTGEGAVVTSTGIEVTGRATTCHLAVTALGDDSTSTSTGFGVEVGRHPGALDPDRVGHEAAGRAVSMLGARPMPTARCALVLDPRTAASVLGLTASTLSGERVVKGRSLFADRLGDAIAAPTLSVVDDPTDVRSLAADTHDGEGMAARATTLIEHGILQSFLHNTTTARRCGTTTTASAVRSYRTVPGVGPQALAVVPGPQSPEDLIATIDDGVWVQSLTGLHSGANLVSGDLSVGIEGRRIRAGELAEPVREVTMATTLPRLLGGVQAIGADLSWLPSGTGSATVVVDEVTISGRG